MLRKALRLCSLLLLCSIYSFAQYCTPTPASGGVYISYLHFGTAIGLTGGTNQSSTGIPAYDNRSATPIGTVQRGCTVSMFFNVGNPTTAAIAFNLRLFIDWNGDGDFADSSETAYDYDYASLAANSSLGTGLNFIVPAFAVVNPRMRYTVRQGGQKAMACGAYTGSIQDYTLTIPTNVAPTLYTGVIPVLNDLVETQTSNDGISVRQFIYSQNPSNPLVSSGESCESIGIAITGTSGTNGQWQYKASNSAWTNMVSVSNTNALLLNGGVQGAALDTRIRFVPTGAGTASITYKAWDKSQGTNGQYINAATGGGSTAFSTATQTTSLTVLSAAATASDVKVYMPDYYTPSNLYNLSVATLSRGTGSMKQATQVTLSNNDGFGNDVVIDATNQKVLWSGGTTGTDIMRSNMDGSGVAKITNGSYTYISGMAISDSKLFFADQGNGIFVSNLDGTGITAITGGAGQANDISETYDIEFANNKIWYVNRSSSGVPFSIASANANGTSTTLLYTASSSSTFIGGLAVTSTNVYWTEIDNVYTSSVKRKNIATGTITTLVSESNQQYYDLMVDETNGLIYYSSYDYSTVSLPFSSARIKTIPLAGGTPINRLLLENQPSALAFYIPTMVLPVKVISIDAYKGMQQISINWKVAGEQEVVDYTVQKSTDGIHFQEMGKLTAAGKSSYTWPDGSPTIGTNYYRISIATKDGKATLTNTVKVDWGKESKPAVSVYPSMVTSSRQVQVAWQNVVSGSYTIKVVNAVGQATTLATVKVGGNNVQTIDLPASLPAGAYWLQVENGTAVWNQKIIIP